MRAVLGLIATGVVVAALAFVATTTTARFLLASGTAVAAGQPCPAGSSASTACPTAAPSAKPSARTAGTARPAASGSPASKHSPTAPQSAESC